MWTRDTLEYLIEMCGKLQVRCIDPDAEVVTRKIQKLYQQAQEQLDRTSKEVDERIAAAGRIVSQINIGR